MKKSSQSTSHIIEVENLTKRYHKSPSTAVNNVSFYVDEGSFFSLLGPNGAGKTTTISILTTIIGKTSGRVLVAGFDIDFQASQVRRNIGVIFQNPSLDRNLTAEENIRFHANLYGLYPYRPSFALMPSKYRHQVQDLAKILGLENDIHKSVKALSGGMKRKLEIIRSLMHHPKILFLDEPTTGLDPISRANLWDYLQQVRKSENITIFLTTHYLEEAESSDYICIINNGKLVEKGTPQEIKDALLERYIEVNSRQPLKLKAELSSLKLKVMGQGPFRVLLNGHHPQKIIQQIKSPLTTLRIIDPTLEQAYVKIIKSDSPTMLTNS